MKFIYWLKNMNYGILAFILATLICFSTLFVRPIIGMADNGDFFRIISQSNLYHLSNNSNDIFLNYFNKDYGIYQYYNENPKMLVSTQILLTKTAVLIDTLFTRDYIFDIRFLSFIYIIIHAVSLYLIVKTLTEGIEYHKYKCIIVALFIFIFCDTGYIVYFNSFFGEAVNLSFFLFSIGILLYMYKFEKFSILNLILFFISSFIFVGSKQQLAPIGSLVSILLIRLFITNKKRSFRYLSLVLAMIMIFSSAYFYKSISGDFDYINRYHAMTRGVLLYEWNSYDTVKEFGMNSQYSLLQETIYFNKLPVIKPNDDKLKKEFYSKYSFMKILEFYLKNPRIFGKMINFSVVNGYSIRPKVMGNYEKREGKALGKQSNFFALWSTVKEKYIPHNLFLTIVAAGIYFGFSIKRYIKSVKQQDINSQLFEEVFLYVFLVGLSQLFVSIIGAGDADLGKHAFMFNVTFDLMFLHSMVLIIKNIYEKNLKDHKGGKKCR